MFLDFGASDSAMSEEEDPFPNRLRAVVAVGSVVMTRRRRRRTSGENAHNPMPKLS